jgi:hypothetical protein
MASVSATPASLKALKDREAALELLEMEGELWTEIEAFRDELFEARIGEQEYSHLNGLLLPFIDRLERDFGHLTTQVAERLSPGVEDAYCEDDRDA